MVDSGPSKWISCKKPRALRKGIMCLALAVSLTCLLWRTQGCTSVTWSSYGSVSLGQPGTKYYVLTGPPLYFQASAYGLRPELGAYGGGPFCVSLDQFEMRFGDLKGWAADYVAVTRVEDRCVEIVIYCQRVPCRRYTFEYDAFGRIRRTVRTEYELRREGEGTSEWAERMKGRTPPVACVWQTGYDWSEDGRMAEVTPQAVSGNRQGIEPMSLPEHSQEALADQWDEKLVWRVSDEGIVTSVLLDGRPMYSAQYDNKGRLLRYQREGTQVENHYDGEGRLRETRVRDDTTFIYTYPGDPKRGVPTLERPGDEAWVVTYDKHGRVSRIREYGGPPDDLMANTVEEFRRDKQGRIIWRRVGFAW